MCHWSPCGLKVFQHQIVSHCLTPICQINSTSTKREFLIWIDFENVMNSPTRSCPQLSDSAKMGWVVADRSCTSLPRVDKLPNQVALNFHNSIQYCWYWDDVLEITGREIIFHVKHKMNDVSSRQGLKKLIRKMATNRHTKSLSKRLSLAFLYNVPAGSNRPHL
jgi:hypothetical protein